MSISASRDRGATWSAPKPIHTGGKSRYSDLAVNADGTVLCLYTYGDVRDSEKICVARFDASWPMAEG